MLVQLDIAVARNCTPRGSRGRASSRTVAAVELVLEHLLRVLLGLLGGVGVVDVGLVAAGDLSFGRHVGLVVCELGDGSRALANLLCRRSWLVDCLLVWLVR